MIEKGKIGKSDELLIMKENRKSLVVYRASAGSGKTFTLATEYIKLLIANPTSYRNILAVTFTNKATEEMKSRILSQLYGISHSLPESRSYLEKVLAADPTLTEMRVVEHAGLALHNLLHNYHYFRVETIDSFFQSVLRNLARELDLTPNLRVGLNDRQMEEQAVDEMIDGLMRGDAVRNHIMNYVADNIDEDKGWNVIGQIKQFGTNIFMDVYRDGRDVFVQKMQGNFFELFTKEMKRLRSNAVATLRRDYDDFEAILNKHHIKSSDLLYGTSGVYGFFCKLKNFDFKKKDVGTRVQQCQQTSSAWVKANQSNSADIETVAVNELMPLLDKTLKDLDKCWSDYHSAKVVLKHINKLRLLGNIEDKVRELNSLHERFQLSDTQHVLSMLMDDRDSPFIFEKIGGRLDHVMIDEFQDTGTKQWRNFKVLLSDCMSRATSQNLIVGDVKQSIYRWRSGDWKILNNIRNEFANSASNLDICTLDTNYRSSENIVNFNNAFFKKAVDEEYRECFTVDAQLASQLKYAYSDVVQQTKNTADKGGHVEITLFPNPSQKKSKVPEEIEMVEGYNEKVLTKIVETVDTLLLQGVYESRMAILVRQNKHIPIIAEYFGYNRPYVKIVSDEAFRLDSSPSVNIIVAAMRYLDNDKDMLNNATLVSLYRSEVLGKDKSLEAIILDRGCELVSLLPEDIVDNRAEIRRLSLIDMAERIYKAFALERIKGQTEYVCAFYDQLAKFIGDVNPSLHAFAAAWEEDICKVTIQDTAVDGIRILSIHKSKGLEFDNVILPFCDWALEHAKDNIMWVKPRKAPFDQLPFIPVDYSKTALMGTVFEDDYKQEYLQNRIDNLNLLYVGFTRAKSGLYIIGSSQNTGSRSELIECCLPHLADTLPGAVYDDGTDSDGTISFSWGKFCEIGARAKIFAEDTSKGQNVFLQKPMPVSVDINIMDGNVDFRQSNDARRFIDGIDGNDDNGYIKMGTILHALFSTIRTTADIAPAVRQLQMDGLLADAVNVERIQALLVKRLADARVADWFSPRWTLFNECKIFYRNAQGEIAECRPDRVMTDGNETIVVDFKFGKPYPGYKNQVVKYMNLLKQMRMPNVKGYIWYVYTNKIETV